MKHFKRWQWRNSIWVTRLAMALGVVAFVVGIAGPQLFQLKVFGFIAIAAVGLSVLGIVMSLWHVERRSVRLRTPVFWLALALNLILIAAVTFLYVRGMNRPALPVQSPGMPNGAQTS